MFFNLYSHYSYQSVVLVPNSSDRFFCWSGIWSYWRHGLGENTSVNLAAVVRLKSIDNCVPLSLWMESIIYSEWWSQNNQGNAPKGEGCCRSKGQTSTGPFSISRRRDLTLTSLKQLGVSQVLSMCICVCKCFVWGGGYRSHQMPTGDWMCLSVPGPQVEPLLSSEESEERCLCWITTNGIKAEVKQTLHRSLDEQSREKM